MTSNHDFEAGGSTYSITNVADDLTIPSSMGGKTTLECFDNNNSDFVEIDACVPIG